MGKNVVSLIFAASLLLAGCEKGQATLVPTDVELTQPIPTALPLPLPTEEPTQQAQATPVAWTATPTELYRLSIAGTPEEFANGTWQEVNPPEIPDSLQPTVIVGENGLLQVKVQLTDYEVPPDGLVIGEYSDGAWHPVPFAFTRSKTATLEVLKLGSGYSIVNEIENPINGFVTFAYSAQFQGMRFEVDEVSKETHLTMLMIANKRVIKFVADSIAIPLISTAGAGYDSSNLSVGNIADVIKVAEEHIPYEKVFFLAVFHVLTDEVTEFYCQGYNIVTPGFRDYCFANVENEERKVKTSQDFRSLVLRSGLGLTPEVVDSGIDWWDDTLIEPISSEAHQTHVSAYFGNLVGE